MIEYHALHTQNRAGRRLEELMIACAAQGEEKTRRAVWRVFDKQARGKRSEVGDQKSAGREPVSETPRSLAEFEAMVKDGEQ